MKKINLSITTCLLCGKCLEVCPVFNATQKEEISPRAKAFLLNKIDKLDLDYKIIEDIVGKCVGCGRCKEVCVQEIDIMSMVSKIRSNSKTLKKWIYYKVIEHMSNTCGILLSTLEIGSFFSFLERYDGIKRLLSENVNLGFLKIHKKNTDKKTQRAVVFSGCIGRYLKDSWREKAISIGKLYFDICEEDVDWSCCGYPLFFAGYLDRAKENFEKNYFIWKELQMPKIIVFCATCYMFLKRQAWIIQDETKRKEWLNSIVYLSNILVSLKGHIYLANHVEEFVLHKPCHMDELSFKKMENFLCSLDIKCSLNTACCGFGGCSRLENPGLCDMLGKNLWENMGVNNIVVSGCSGCVLQFALTNPMSKSYHWLDLIDFV